MPDIVEVINSIFEAILGFLPADGVLAQLVSQVWDFLTDLLGGGGLI